MSTVRQLKEVPGLLSCVFSHEVTKTTHKFTWTGPKLNAIWPEVLAFFKWTHDTMKSESQVRLFVNPTTKEWRAWAFPQQAKTSMAAHEIKEGEDGYERTKEQRAQFNDDWYYWGTAHHHCSMSAFQSGTDTNNEESQDGLHITVGHLDKPTMNIHYRVYQSGIKICDSNHNPPGVPMSTFWDIGDALEAIPPQFRHLLRSNIEEEMVLLQMGTHPPADTVINQQWKDNVIDITPKAVVTRLDNTPTQGSFYSGMHGHSEYAGGVFIGKRIFTERSKNNYASDLEKAVRDTIRFCVEGKHKIEDVAYWFEQMCSTWDDDILNMLDIVLRNDVNPDIFLKYLRSEIKMAQAKSANPQNQKGGKGNGRKGGNKQQNQGDYHNLSDEEKEKLLDNWEREYYGGVHGGTGL